MSWGTCRSPILELALICGRVLAHILTLSKRAKKFIDSRRTKQTMYVYPCDSLSAVRTQHYDTASVWHYQFCPGDLFAVIK